MNTDEELDKLAEEVYDWCCSRRVDNLDKKGNPSDPRKISSPYPLAIDNVKHFYRDVVRWHLNKVSNNH